MRKGSLALPDRGSVEKTKFEVSSSASRSSAEAATGCSATLRSIPAKQSNALLVSGRESASGRPLAVFGPQTGYFNPQILMEIDLHGPGIDARGAAFNGVNLYVTLGRGRDYAWSATSSSQDIIDTFAVDLCEPSGATADQALHALPLPRPLPADGDAGAPQQLEPQPRRQHPRGHPDPAGAAARRSAS